MSKPIPQDTQISATEPQNHQPGDATFVYVVCDNETEREDMLRKKVTDYCPANYVLIKESELKTATVKSRVFILSIYRENVVKLIQTRFDTPKTKTKIIIARAFIEQDLSEKFGQKARIRCGFVIRSLTMFDCVVLIGEPDLWSKSAAKIREMSGQVTQIKGDKKNPTVALVDSVTSRTVRHARRLQIPVVSLDWLDHYWNVAIEDEDDNFVLKASDGIAKFIIKPFYGLRIKIMMINERNKKLETLISNHGGLIVHGNGGKVQPTHYLYETFEETQTARVTEKVDKIDIEFVQQCVREGHYIPVEEYAEQRRKSILSTDKNKILSESRKQSSQNNKVEKQRKSHLQSLNNKSTEENRTPSTQDSIIDNTQTEDMVSQTSDCYNNIEDVNLQPPTNPCQQKQPDHMNEMILRALAFDTPQTQLASTQMRRLPDSELKIEQTYEPSQQLYWNDCSSRR